MWRKLAVALSVTALSALPAMADAYQAKVVSVKDGDSITILHGDQPEKVILYGVDCPELGQDFGDQAKSFTDQCCYNKIVSIEEHGKDKFGRTVVVVTLSDGANLNQELVKRGLAWWSDKYAPEDSTLRDMHTSAKAQHLGLWAASNPIPPWIFRNGDREVQATIKPKQQAP